MAQVGQAPRSSEPAENNSWMENRLKFVESLTRLGFQSIQDYDEVRKVAISSLGKSQLVHSDLFLLNLTIVAGPLHVWRSMAFRHCW